MGIIQMVACDNPKCKSVGQPEDVGKRGKFVGPYGWFEIEFRVIGPTGMLEVVACSDKCIEPAISEKLRIYYQQD